MGRHLGFDVTDKLDAAVQVFWRKGYTGASLEDILSGTGLSKSSLYQTYGDKPRLYSLCLDRYTDCLVDRIRNMAAGYASPRRFIRDFVVSAVKQPEEGEPAVHPSSSRLGCLLMNAAAELGHTDPDFAPVVRECLGRMTGLFEEILRNAQARKELDEAVDVRARARFWLNCMAGFSTMLKSGMPQEALDQLADNLVAALERPALDCDAPTPPG